MHVLKPLTEHGCLYRKPSAITLGKSFYSLTIKSNKCKGESYQYIHTLRILSTINVAQGDVLTETHTCGTHGSIMPKISMNWPLLLFCLCSPSWWMRWHDYEICFKQHMIFKGPILLVSDGLLVIGERWRLHEQSAEVNRFMFSLIFISYCMLPFVWLLLPPITSISLLLIMFPTCSYTFLL